MDAFYVTRNHHKLTSPRAISELKQALTAALEDAEVDVPRRRLERARASIAR